MREILFRGKRIDNGEWVEGFYSGEEYNPFTNIIEYIPRIQPLGKCVCLGVIPETVGQYIGLSDKNGRKIFEGDIVRERGGESCQGYYEIDNVLIVEIPDTLLNFEMSYDCEYKIIGNIHDNPELLGGDSE